ncbi:MAG: hypothetical protein ACE5JG_01135 [Planctomycetota bacterium]
MAEKSRYAVVAALLAFLAGGWLTLEALSVGPRQRTQRVDRQPSREVQLPEGLRATTTVDTGRRSERTDESTKTASLDVDVRDGATGRPLANASVLVVRDSPMNHRLGFLLPAEHDVVRRARTDETGSCTIEVARSLPPGCRIVATRAGYTPGIEAIPRSGSARVTLELAKGLTIAGRVVDSAGRPVAGVVVRGTHTECPAGAVGYGLAGTLRKGWATARTGPGGRFVLDSLSDGLYRLEGGGDGWRTRPPWMAAGGPRQDEFVSAGSENAQIVVLPIRMYRVRLLHGDSGVPVSQPAVISVVRSRRTPHGARIDEGGAQLLTEGGSMRIAPTTSIRFKEQPPGVHVDYVDLAAAGEVPGTVGVVIQVQGYRPAITEVRLMLPSEVKGTRRADEVRLHPRPFFQVGTLVADLSRSERSKWLGIGTPVVVTRTIPPSVAQGRHLEGTRWEFPGMPAGRFDVQFLDGLSRSDILSVEVQAGGTERISVAMPAPTGLAVNLRGPEGGRLFDATVGLKPREAEGSFKAPPELTALHLSGGAVRPTVFELPPGSYRYVVTKRGFRTSEGTTSVRAGAVTTLDVVLERD